MKLGRHNHIGVATPSIAVSLPVIASEARQSSSTLGIMDCRVALLLAGDGHGNDPMRVGRFNHIGVATPSIADSIVLYHDV